VVRCRGVRASRRARLFYSANAALIRKAAEAFYGALKRRFPSCEDVGQAGVAVLDQDPTLRCAALLVAGTTPRFVLRLPPAGGRKRGRRIVASQVVRPDVQYNGRSLTQLQYGPDDGHLQFLGVLRLWPRRRSRPAGCDRRGAGVHSIQELLRQADAGPEPPTECPLLVIDLVDDMFMSVLYDTSKSAGPGRTAAAFAGAIVGRAEMVRRLHLPRHDVSPWSTFTLRLRLRSALGEETDPLWGVALRRAMRQVGWFSGMSSGTPKHAQVCPVSVVTSP
jgi:hypothetical protein